MPNGEKPQYIPSEFKLALDTILRSKFQTPLLPPKLDGRERIIHMTTPAFHDGKLLIFQFSRQNPGFPDLGSVLDTNSSFLPPKHRNRLDALRQLHRTPPSAQVKK